MQNSIEYQLTFDKFGNKRKYKVSKKRRLKIIDNSSWIENELKNQWIYKDYRCFYIVISMFRPSLYKVSISVYSHKTQYKELERAKIASLRLCDKILK